MEINVITFYTKIILCILIFSIKMSQLKDKKFTAFVEFRKQKKIIFFRNLKIGGNVENFPYPLICLMISIQI